MATGRSRPGSDSLADADDSRPREPVHTARHPAAGEPTALPLQPAVVSGTVVSDAIALRDATVQWHTGSVAVHRTDRAGHICLVWPVCLACLAKDGPGIRFLMGVADVPLIARVNYSS